MPVVSTSSSSIHSRCWCAIRHIRSRGISAAIRWSFTAWNRLAWCCGSRGFLPANFLMLFCWFYCGTMSATTLADQTPSQSLSWRDGQEKSYGNPFGWLAADRGSSDWGPTSHKKGTPLQIQISPHLLRSLWTAPKRSNEYDILFKVLQNLQRCGRRLKE